MPARTVNIHAAKTGLSRLIRRVEKGERIVIARDGVPVAELGPVAASTAGELPADDPLLNLKAFAIDGPGGRLTNEDIDQILYGKPGSAS